MEENLQIGLYDSRPRKRVVPVQVFDHFPILGDWRAQPPERCRRRAAATGITRALAGDPSVLIPDEPFEGIQPNLVLAIADRLNRLAAESGIATLLIERNLDAAIRFTDRRVFMEGGRIVHGCPAGDLRDPSLVDRLLSV